MKDNIQQKNIGELSKQEKARAYHQAYYQANKEKIKALRATAAYKANQKIWYEANKEKLKTYSSVYREVNKEKILANYRDYHQKTINERRVYAKAYRETNLETIKANVRNARRTRVKTDPLFKFVLVLREHSRRAFKRIGVKKPTNTQTLLGCNWQEARAHFEKLFQPGMTWSNHGEWHVDHIIPIASATTLEEAIKLNHISNLQPLWAEDNLVKGHKIYD